MGKSSSTAGLPNASSLKIDQNFVSNAWLVPSRSNTSSMFYGSRDASLFSSSLPVLPHEKLNLPYVNPVIQSKDDASSELKDINKDIAQDCLVESDVHGIGSLIPDDVRGIGSLLPDDEEALLAGVVEDFDLSELPGQMEEMEEFDIFGSSGGMELDLDPMENLNLGISSMHLNDGYLVNGITQYGPSNGGGSIVGEHPYGEHPSRTLFVRNINSNVEDSELRSLFEQYGDIRTMYTTCKNRGFVMISYYDIRAARTAMRALQNKPLRRRKLDIHFSIPKENPTDKDLNQGTLVIFNLDPSVSNDDLLQLFGEFGEVKEIRETPHKRHHKFIEFYDVRDAEAALRALNRSDIAGKRIKLEPSRPGGSRRSLILQINQDMEKDDTRVYRPHGSSPVDSSPPGIWAQFSSPIESDSFSSFSRSSGTSGPLGGNYLPGLASLVPTSSNSKIFPFGKEQSKISHADHDVNRNQISLGLTYQHSHSFPEKSEMMLNVASIKDDGPSFIPTLNASSVGTITGSQSLWGSPPFSDFSHPSSWQSMRQQISSNGQGQGQRVLFPGLHAPFIGSPSSHNHLYHHVGSAPSGISFERPFGYFSEPPGASFLSPSSFGTVGMARNDGSSAGSIGASKASLNHGVALSGGVLESNQSNLRMLASQRLGNSLFGSIPFLGPDGVNERARSRRADSYGAQMDSKKQYQLDLEKITSGEDARTTLMIKNIPNKYTSKMLLATIDEKHKGTYDFLYLPIDFKNKCNVGYAFINMLSPSHILPFYQTFNGKKWEKFNSEKVASLAYARIQGKVALVSHFQNSSLMNEDKRCRPILFHSEGSESGNEEQLTSVGLNIFVRQQDGTILGDAPESPESMPS